MVDSINCFSSLQIAFSTRCCPWNVPLWQDKKSGTFLSREIWPRWGQLIWARASFCRSDNNQPISSSAGNFKGHRGALRDLPIWEPRHQIWNSLQSLLSDESEWRSQKYQNTMDRSKRLRKRWPTLNKRDQVRIYWFCFHYCSFVICPIGILMGLE